MQKLYCHCGYQVYPNNRYCLNCGNGLGLDCLTSTMISFAPSTSSRVEGWDGVSYRLCHNRFEHDACNGLVPASSNDARCFPCSLNRTIPNLDNPGNLQRWQRLEEAKRRLICGLSALGLPGIDGIRFDFLEDKRSHPDALETFISTGHSQGVITINTLEADDVQRTRQQQMSSERYRTLLGHFRHEAGHYYYNILAWEPATFIDRFGDPGEDYDAALQRHYNNGPVAGWEQSCISAYASSHPHEDWAETFAHYLHIRDAMETAHAFGLWEQPPVELDQKLLSWSRLSLALNEVSQALGRQDAYPFIVNQRVAEKLTYIHELVTARETATST
jgi:hypothetical protein